MERFVNLIYPPKCVLCQRVLPKDQNDLCHRCRLEVPEFTFAKKKISFVADWVSLWYYSGTVRKSLMDFKFYHKRTHANIYGRLLAMRLTREGMTDFDVMTYVPISLLRNMRRGYDQVALLAKATARELGITHQRILVKHRHTPAQSSIADAAMRRANVLGAYHIKKNVDIVGKKILLLDDIITTGATVSECARVLLTAGAKEVICAAVAASEPKKDVR